jgi:hypothetical protein
VHAQSEELLARIRLPAGTGGLLEAGGGRTIVVPRDRAQLIEAALGGEPDRFEVAYDIPRRGRVVEAEVVRARNGVAVNMPEPYMRRRDPDCMVVADQEPSDKPRFADRFGAPFQDWRTEIVAWLTEQSLLVLPFRAGRRESNYDALLVAPLNAAFFAAALADLQGMLPPEELPTEFTPRAIIYVAPPFRHTHCDGRQVVVHHRLAEVHEVFALNLYPGPSAKKGIYGVLLALGAKEGWVTTHASTVQVITPYDNITTIMHEGASGGGKSEMLEYAHREPDGRLLFGRNLITDERIYLTLPRGCELRPVTDDMASCHPDIQKEGGRLVVADAEDGWFLRINHISTYGVDPHLEQLCVHPVEPLVFLNLHAVADATCLIWEHVEDSPGAPCPNPRVIVPRRAVPGVVNEPVEVDVRSFGVRTPPYSADSPSYGIVGILHVLPPALAWLWRLVAPRGHANPSITESAALSSEGVGSYWPFATGRRVHQANLLLSQIRATPKTRYVLIPNQYIGCWHVGFMPQWIGREYIARRGGARFRPDQLATARCPLLGYTLTAMLIEGVQINPWFLQVELQPEVGAAGYDAGARMLRDFFHRELAPYLDEADLDPLGRRIIECCLQGGAVEVYQELLGGA